MFKDGIWCFEKFGGQTTKNVQGVQKIALRMFNVCLDGAWPVSTSFSCLFWIKFM